MQGRCYTPAAEETAGNAMLDEIKKDAQVRMTKSVDALRQDLMHLRTGRASPALLEPLQVNYYGSEVPLNQVANVAVADARSLTIQPYEKQMVGPIEKAILAANLGLTPTTVGQVIRINMPALTEQRRKELAKHVAGEGEDSKVAVRNIRRDAIHHIKELLKDKKITEDEERRAEDDIQKLTDRFVKDIDGVVKHKEDELMAI
jgi:ribosome recycling factor